MSFSGSWTFYQYFLFAKLVHFVICTVMVIYLLSFKQMIKSSSTCSSS